MITSEATVAVVSPDDDDWVPAWWGTEEENLREAEEFAKWTRSVAKS